MQSGRKDLNSVTTLALDLTLECDESNIRWLFGPGDTWELIEPRGKEAIPEVPPGSVFLL